MARRILCLLAMFFPILPAAAFAEDAVFGGSKIVVQEGEKAKEHEARVTFRDSKELAIEDRKGKQQPWAVVIPFDQIKEMTYEKSAHPRTKTAIFISPFALFSKAKKHWLTVTYTRGDATDFVFLHLDKKEYQRMIAVAEAKTGLKVERIMEE